MSLQRQQASLIKQGWIRAIILLVIYISITAAGGLILPSADLWFTLNFIAAFGLVYVFRKYIDNKSFETIGFSFSRFFPDAATGLLFGIFLVSTGSLLIYFLKGLEWIDTGTGVSDFFYSLILLVMVAASEELVFRGYVLRNLMKSINKWLALVVSSLLFTIVHFSNPNVLPVGLLNTFLGGLVLGITFINTRSLWLPVFFHFSWNWMQGPVLGYPVSGLPFDSLLIMQTKGSPLISGGNYGFEGSVICTVLLVLALILWGYFETKRSHAVY